MMLKQLALMMLLTVLPVSTLAAQQTPSTSATTNLTIQPPRLSADCQRTQPSAGVTLAVFSGLCEVTFEVFTDANPVVWYLDGSEVSRGKVFTFAPINESDALVTESHLQAIAAQFDGPTNVRWYQSDILTIEIAKTPHAALTATKANACQWLDSNLSGTCSKLIDNLLSLVVGAVMAALGTMVLL